MEISCGSFELVVREDGRLDLELLKLLLELKLEVLFVSSVPVQESSKN
jgi:hypothetical protein